MKLQRVIACLFLCAACERPPATPFPIGAPATGAYPLPDTTGASAHPRAAGVPAYGRLSPSEVQKIVRANFRAMRDCYDAGLQRDPKLQGGVATKFVIARDGRVSSASLVEAAAPDAGVIDGGARTQTRAPGTTLPDRIAAECVRDVFTTLVFPAPKNGVVTVVYPLTFAPGN